MIVSVVFALILQAKCLPVYLLNIAFDFNFIFSRFILFPIEVQIYLQVRVRTYFFSSLFENVLMFKINLFIKFIEYIWKYICFPKTIYLLSLSSLLHSSHSFFSAILISKKLLCRRHILVPGGAEDTMVHKLNIHIISSNSLQCESLPLAKSFSVT